MDNFNKDQNLEERIILIFQNKYESRLKQIQEDYKRNALVFSKENLKKCIFDQKNLVIQMIREVLSFYPNLKKSQFVALNGSYARGTNLWNSDLDFNLFYENDFRDILFPIELRIHYILSKLLGFRGCDRIHSIMVYTPFVYFDFPSFNGKSLLFQSENIPYFCRENYEKLLNESFQTSRDYKVLENYFDLRRKKQFFFDEWTNNFELVQDYGQFYPFHKGILKRDSLIFNHSNFNQFLLQEINQVLVLIDQFSFLEKNEWIEIKKIKQIYKANPMKILYRVFSIFIRIYHLHETNISSLVSNEIIDERLETMIYYYLWCVLRIQIILDLFDYDLSSHSTQRISWNKFSKIYEQKYHDNFKNITESAIKELFSQIIIVLQLERRKLM